MIETEGSDLRKEGESRGDWEQESMTRKHREKTTRSK